MGRGPNANLAIQYNGQDSTKLDVALELAYGGNPRGIRMR